MKKSILTTAIIAFIIVVAIAGYVAFPSGEQQRQPEAPRLSDRERPEEPSHRGFSVDAIEALHTYANGQHRYTGTIVLPDPCYSIQTNVVIRESFPEQVTIEFETPRTGDLCAQVLSEQPFEVRFKASEQASVNATLNGDPVKLLITSKKDVTE